MIKENKIFEELRNTPTEISEEAVLKMIKGFPSMPLQPLEPSKWKGLLNIKNIIMISIPATITIGLLMLNQLGNETSIVAEVNPIIETKNENVVELSKLNPPEPQLMDVRKIVLGENDPVVKDISPVADIKESPKTTIASSRFIPQISIRENNTISPEVIKDHTNESLENIKETAAAKPQKAYIKLVPNLNPDFEKSPILSGPKMKKIRKFLYENLVGDGIISSKSISVEMLLPGNKIIVNGTELSFELYKKYATLTQEVKSGPNRKIKMDKKYVIIGDFNLDGFYGAGIGSFNDALLEKGFKDKNSKSFKRKSLFDSEYDSLLEFAKGIRTPLDGKSPLFGINLNYENAEYLHGLLKAQLQKDNFMNEDNKFALIQHQKEQLIINGNILEGDQKVKYSEIIASFNIKPKKFREILLSDKIICAGDNTSGEFTGTISIIE